MFEVVLAERAIKDLKKLDKRQQIVIAKKT